MKFIPFCFLVVLFSCNNSSTENDSTKIDSVVQNPNVLSQDIFKSKVVILLNKAMDDTSTKIVVQDYVESGKSFIPVFTSLDKYNESTKGADLGKPKIEIDGMFLLSLMDGKERLRVNPSLADETYFNSSDLRKTFEKEIAEVVAKTSK